MAVAVFELMVRDGTKIKSLRDLIIALNIYKDDFE